MKNELLVLFFYSHGSILQNLESQSLFGYNKNFLFQTTWISTIGILDGSMMVRDVRMIPSQCVTVKIHKITSVL